MKRIFLTIFIGLFFAPTLLAAVKSEVKQGNLLYNEGEFYQALEKYETVLDQLPESEVVNFNAGAAAYKLEDYLGAVDYFEKSLLTEDEDFLQKTSYNLGNAEYKLGISKEDEVLDQAIALLEQSLRHYKGSLKIDSEDADAKYNYEFVKKELERLKEQQEQSSGQNDKEKEDGDDSQDSQSSEQDQPQKNSKGNQSDGQDSQNQDQNEEKGDSDQGDNQEQSEESDDQSDSQKEPKDQKSGQKETPGDAEQMSTQQAQMLLESYQNSEEPDTLYNEKLPSGKPKKVDKNW
jgi:Ca-activated chloride channel homolog